MLVVVWFLDFIVLRCGSRPMDVSIWQQSNEVLSYLFIKSLHDYVQLLPIKKESGKFNAVGAHLH